jgi:hypothetical protein
MQNSGIWKMVLGLVSIAIAFVMFPIVLDGVSSITGHSNIALFTGLSSVANIAPLIIFVGLLFGGGAGMVSGYRSMKG